MRLAFKATPKLRHHLVINEVMNRSRMCACLRNINYINIYNKGDCDDDDDDVDDDDDDDYANVTMNLLSKC